MDDHGYEQAAYRKAAYRKAAYRKAAYRKAAYRKAAEALWAEVRVLRLAGILAGNMGDYTDAEALTDRANSYQSVAMSLEAQT